MALLAAGVDSAPMELMLWLQAMPGVRRLHRLASTHALAACDAACDAGYDARYQWPAAH